METFLISPPRQPISPICRAPLFPISQNVFPFFSLTPISPICRTPLLPISQNLIRFFGAETPRLDLLRSDSFEVEFDQISEGESPGGYSFGDEWATAPILVREWLTHSTDEQVRELSEDEKTPGG